ncbi:MAG TPA: NADPH-dependent FMN reductase [Terriglobia bacterium]|nr:NADPH-dependent FMN reductase [Terriglobia bacterium]
MTIVGMSGSLRKNSFNAGLLRAAAEFLSADTRLEILSIREVPLYDADVEEASGVPAAVQQIKDRVAAGDGLLLATPEYNNSIPGVFKNVIDWMSRPPADIAKVFGDRPVAVMGATPGMGGTTLAQSSWLPVLRTLQMRPWFGGRLLVSGARQAFDAQGNLTDEKIRGQLKTFIAGFEGFIRRK